MSRWHGARRVAPDRIRVRLSVRERNVLRTLPGQVRPILVGDVAADAVRQRLFPSAYDDPLADLEFRELMGDSLLEEKVALLDVFAQTLDGGQVGAAGWSVELSDEEAHAWLAATNDARLLLAGILGITSEDQWEAGALHDDPAGMLLSYLSWLQEELLAVLLSGFAEG